MSKRLKLVTWNLAGLDERSLDERMEAMCFSLLLNQEHPDIVLFQEVVDRSFTAHLGPHFLNAGFSAVKQPPATSYWCAAFFRSEVCQVREARVVPFPGTIMGRMLLEAHVDWQGQDLWVGTAHLESLKQGAGGRAAQTTLIAKRMADHDGPAVFAGDTNLRDSEVKGIAALADLQDAWVAVGSPKDRRFTWDSSRNASRPNRGRPVRIRFDRIWLNRHPGWTATSVSFLGEQPIAGDLHVSDHVGLEVGLTL